MKAFIAIAAVLILAGCASPTLKMTDQEIQALSDQQLCNYQNHYGPDTRRDAEIARRGLICGPYIRQCMAEGNQPDTPQMDYCVYLLQENERLRTRYYDDPFWSSLHRPYERRHLPLH